MNQLKPPQAMSLFDLIARQWTLQGAVRQVLFNGNGTAVVAALADGSMAFVPTKDAEHPEKRMRTDLETGRMTIRPREKPLPAPIVSEETVAAAALPVCRLGETGFSFVHRSGAEVWRATARGQTLRLAADGGPVTALCAVSGSDRIASAHGRGVTLRSGDTGEVICAGDLDHEVDRIAASGDGRLLAAWGPGRLSVLRSDDLGSETRLECAGEVIALAWSPDNRWIAAGCEDKCLLLVDVSAGACDRIVDFPSSVSDVAFSRSAGVMIASGAFRVVGWKLPDLPFGEHEGTHVETGKPGLTIVDRLSPHPSRDLCAAAYANGLVTIGQIGRRDELMLKEGGGAAVTSLAWSDDGAHLAIGQEDGTLSVVTFPKSMFK